jgi:hypothetical protein
MIPIQNIRTKEDNEHNIIHLQCDITYEELNRENYNIDKVKEYLAKYKDGMIVLGLEDFTDNNLKDNKE